MIASTAKGLFKDLLILCVALSGFNHEGTMILIACQQFLAKCLFKDLLILCVALSGFNHEGTMIPIACQQFLVKGHLKNKCMSISSP
jgi:hypothetical protein